MKTYDIHLIRNASTAANEEGRYLGHTDEPLSRRGRQELTDLLVRAAYPRADVVFTSPLQRCTQTAKIIYPENKPLVLNDLIEINFGEFDCKSADELKDHPLFADWLSGKPGIAPPFGESNEEFARRICQAFERIIEGIIKSGTSSCALVTHSGIITAWLALYGLPEANMNDWVCPPGHGYSLLLMPSLWMKAKKIEVTERIPALEGE